MFLAIYEFYDLKKSKEVKVKPFGLKIVYFLIVNLRHLTLNFYPTLLVQLTIIDAQLYGQTWIIFQYFAVSATERATFDLPGPKTNDGFPAVM